MINLSSFASINIGLMVWAGLWGILGAFHAAPITAIMTNVASEFQGTRPVAVLLRRI